jgi:hypothetical protein
MVVMLGWDWSLETRVEMARRIGGCGFTMRSSARMPMRRVRWFWGLVRSFYVGVSEVHANLFMYLLYFGTPLLTRVLLVLSFHGMGTSDGS